MRMESFRLRLCDEKTGDDRSQNPYVTGAKLALYDAIRVNQTGDSQDHAFEGVEVTRDRNGNVTDIVVKEGYAGEKLEFSRDRASVDEMREKIPGKSRQ